MTGASIQTQMPGQRLNSAFEQCRGLYDPSRSNFTDGNDPRVTEFFEALLSFAATVTARLLRTPRASAAADDTAQKSAMTVLRKLSSFESSNGAAFSTWAHRVIANEAKTHLRNLARSKLQTFSELEGPEGWRALECSPAEPQGGPRIEIEELTATRRALMRRVFTRLTDEHQRYLELSSNGLKFKQIAETMEKPLGTVKRGTFDARNAFVSALMSILGDNEEETVATLQALGVHETAAHIRGELAARQRPRKR